MASDATVKCPICGEPYKTYPDYTGDQSACPKCRKKAEENMRRKPKEWEHGEQ